MSLQRRCRRCSHSPASAGRRRIRAVQPGDRRRGHAVHRGDLLPGVAGLVQAQELSAAPEAAVRGGSQILVLSDRGITATTTYIPPLLAVGAVHHHLLNLGVRETGQ